MHLVWQEMPPATRAAREAELSAEGASLAAEHMEAARVAETMRVRAEVAARARACGEQLLQVALPRVYCRHRH